MENINSKRSLVDELIEDKELDQKIVKSFYSKKELSSDIFEKKDGSYKLHKGVRDKLLEISNAFIDFVGVTFFTYDIILTGSMSNYNWSDFSDIDIHIIIDIEEFGEDFSNSQIMKSIIKEFFDTKKNNWSQNHNINIKNYDVEIYVQDINEKHISSGVYSILNDQWIIEPIKGKDGIDEKKILEKGEEYAQLLNNLIKKSSLGKDITNELNNIREKLKKFRQSGLEKGGEYSYENLTFKLLRRNGYIDKLLNLKKSLTDKKLSVS